MLTIFLYGSTPGEYLHHLFAHHKDTVDHPYKPGQYEISTRHVHCSFLDVKFGPFLHTSRQYLVFESVFHISKWIDQSLQSPACHFPLLLALRGPPSIIV